MCHRGDNLSEISFVMKAALKLCKGSGVSIRALQVGQGRNFGSTGLLAIVKPFEQLGRSGLSIRAAQHRCSYIVVTHAALFDIV